MDFYTVLFTPSKVPYSIEKIGSKSVGKRFHGTQRAGYLMTGARSFMEVGEQRITIKLGHRSGSGKSLNVMWKTWRSKKIKKSEELNGSVNNSPENIVNYLGFLRFRLISVYMIPCCQIFILLLIGFCKCCSLLCVCVVRFSFCFGECVFFLNIIFSKIKFLRFRQFS